MKKCLQLLLIVGWLLCICSAATLAAEYQWKALPPVPDAEGFAGMFAGVSGEGLLAAGGANFPEAKPWEGGTKVWYDTVYRLESPTGTWKEVGKLPRPLAYGVSITLDEGVLCIGGSDAEKHYAECFVLKWDDGKLAVESFPSLPLPRANLCGVRIDSNVLVFGGTEQPTSTQAAATLWKLDLKDVEKGWEELAPLPGPGRILPTAAVQSGDFFVMGGASLHADEEGKPARTYLVDAWRFSLKSGWRQIADLPQPSVAAPSPAPAVGISHFLLIGGDDGAQVGVEPTEHKGFPKGVLAYDTITDTWTQVTEFPTEAVKLDQDSVDKLAVSPPVTLPVVKWGDQFVLVSGEVRPGIRSPNVVALTVSPTPVAFGFINWAVVAIYLSGMVGIGWWFMQRDVSKTTDGYFRGGQKIPGWVAGLSIFATMLSSLTFMGIPARAYQTDMSWYIGQLPVLVVIPLVAYYYLPFFRGLNITSAYEYLERRFNLAVRLFASLSFILYHIGRIAIVLYLPALALSAVSDISVIAAILVIGVLCLIYTVMGGITAVVWTDAIQAIVLMCGAVLCLGLAMTRVTGGMQAAVDIATTDHKVFSGLDASSWSVADGTTSVWVIFIAFLFNALVPYTSGQDVVQRYVTTKDIPTARRSLWLTMWMSVFGSLVFFFLGVAIYAFYKTHPAELEPSLASSDSILPFYIVKQLPVGVSGLVIAAIFAASQSTISSSLNSIAAAWITDFDSRLLRPGRQDAEYLSAARNVVIVIGAIGIGVACWMAQTRIDSAFKTFNTLIGLTAGSLGGLFALGVFTKRANGVGAIIGAVSGLGIVLLVRHYKLPVTGLLYATIGCTSCFVLGYLFSLVGPAPKAESAIVTM
ncbi:MAG: sodium/solute symporter [Planctomycetaceae bacterium]|nr:sodium/solute symporter [Planctomycetaceae bacterium]MCB9954009.1 sodium/solute symporter [Planctomycetaceae bacterium]